MGYWLLGALIFVAHPSFAELYKCTSGTKITYQDKPCQSTQTQTMLPVVVKPSQHVQSLPGTVKIAHNAHGKIKRSHKAKKAFKASHPCPATGKRFGACPGYVIDHIQPLACGGADSSENMQWQTIAEGKEKDGWERKNCAGQYFP